MKSYVDMTIPEGNLCKRATLSLAALAVIGIGGVAIGQDAATVSEIAYQQMGDRLEVRIKGDANMPYTSYELFNPDRLVVDLANARLKSGVSANLPQHAQVKLQTREISDPQFKILRMEFLMQDSFPYTAKHDGDAVVVNFDLNKNKSKLTKVAATADSTASGSALAKQLPDTTRAVSTPSVGGSQDDFGFSGYDRERISVDFYKMDLHNVFRFLREISGVNIVVDEGVSGTLTLTLDNVPWDFALDVILNLKGLQQEERFNTIVIYPKKKEFIWPKKAESKLSFQADETIAQQEALVITQMEQQPAGLVEASQLIEKGNAFEKQHNPAMAVQAYEEAFEKWHTNGKLANRISSIYLVDLRQNAKALQYAKEALKIDKKDWNAALNAAVASANMRDMQSAATYFDMATQGSKPSQEALLSYALFREEARQYDQALQILSKHDALYGKNLEAMIAVARILDKAGASAQATQAYRAILSSGFALPSDLSRFVRARVGMAN